MRGSIHYQIVAVFNESGIFVPGQSKHCAKQLARSKGNRGSHDVSKQLGGYLAMQQPELIWIYGTNVHHICGIPTA